MDVSFGQVLFHRTRHSKRRPPGIAASVTAGLPMAVPVERLVERVGDPQLLGVIRNRRLDAADDRLEALGLRPFALPGWDVRATHDETHLGQSGIVAQPELVDHHLEGASRALVCELGIAHVEGPSGWRTSLFRVDEDKLRLRVAAPGDAAGAVRTVDVRLRAGQPGT